MHLLHVALLKTSAENGHYSERQNMGLGLASGGTSSSSQFGLVGSLSFIRKDLLGPGADLWNHGF